MASKKKHKAPGCSCCKNEIPKAQASKTVGTKISLGKEFIVVTYYGLSFGTVKWACDDCLNSGKAILGNTSRQKFIDHSPYLAFIDETRICALCKEEYIFKKEEKKFWYEELQFWVQSEPKHCIPCRTKLRNIKEIKLELGRLLRDKVQLTKATLEQIAELYTKLDKPEKVKEYKTLARKARN